MFQAIALFLGGVLASSSYIVARRPDAQNVIDKIKPFQGIIGIILLIIGVVAFFQQVSYFGWYLRFSFFWGIIIISAIVVEIILGIILGYPLIAEYALKNNAEALEKGNAVRDRLAKYQTLVGLTAIVLSILWLLIVLRVISPFGF